MQVRFKGTVWRTGNSNVVTIPLAYIENGIVPREQELEFSVEVPDA